MRSHKVILTIFMGLMLVVTVAFMALLFVDPSVFRSQLELRASKALGREISINGSLRLERSLRPRIWVEDISIGNPSWAVNTYFATVDRISIQVALLPLLIGNLEGLEISLAGVDLFLEERSDGSNNYTFSDPDKSDTPRGLPPIDQLMVKDGSISYQTAEGRENRYEINNVRFLNIPGEPIRIEGQGTARGKTIKFALAADTEAELSGPHYPWSAKLNIAGPDVSIVIDGRLAKISEWDKGKYHLTLNASSVSSLDQLLGVELPTTGPFRLSTTINRDNGSFRLTDIVTKIQWATEAPVINIIKGEAFGGRDAPLRVTLKGQINDVPAEFSFESAQGFNDLVSGLPWPAETKLRLTGTELMAKGVVTRANNAAHIEFETQLQGDSLQTLTQLLNTNPIESGPYQLSFNAKFAEGNYSLANMEGEFLNILRWQRVQIIDGEADAFAKGPLKGSIEARLDQVPLNFNIQGRPEASAANGRTSWGINIVASAAGLVFTGEGDIVDSVDGKITKMTTQISGDSMEALEPLIGVSLPLTGKFNVSADIRSAGSLHEALNMEIMLGDNQITGEARWESALPRPNLTGTIAADSLSIEELLERSSHPSPKTEKAGILDRHITLEWLKELDAELSLSIAKVMDGPLPLQDIEASVKLTDGRLNLPFRGNVSGAEIDGQIVLDQVVDAFAVSLNTEVRQIDIKKILSELEIANNVVGTADVLDLQVESSGKNLGDLSRNAAFTLRLKPAEVIYSTEIISQEATFKIESLDLTTQRAQPIAASLSGTVQDIPFNATINSGSIADIIQEDKAVPLKVEIWTADTRLKAEGTITRPWSINTFAMEYELAGKKIEGLDALFDFVVPMRGSFSASGDVSAQDNIVIYNGDLQIGNSNLKAFFTVEKVKPRPQITGQIKASKIYLPDVKLVDSDEGSAETDARERVIPDYTIPVDIFSAVDLDLDIDIERIDSGLDNIGEFGNLAADISLKNGMFQSNTYVTGDTGLQIRNVVKLDTAVDPPLKKIEFTAQDLDHGLLLYQTGVTDLLEGRINIYIDLSGLGATRYEFLSNVKGYIKVVGGPGKITSRVVDLWAAGLITTMLSPDWQRQAETELNCIVTHIEMNDGLAEIKDFLMDTQRITIAGSGVLDLETEALEFVVAPRPKRASLVSLANPVRIGGTLSDPEVSVTRLPRGRRLLGAGAGLLTGLVNPAFLVLTFSDLGTGHTNPCDVAVQRAYENLESSSTAE